MDTLKKGSRVLQEDGIIPASIGALRYLNVWNPIWNTISSRYPGGTNIFSREWDLLIVLDACRYDSFYEVAESSTWITNIEEVQSVGSMSAEWTLKTFTNEYKDDIGETALITGNVWTDQLLNENQDKDKYKKAISRGVPKWNTVTVDDFCYYEYTRGYLEDSEKLHPDSRGSPHITTDRAISVGRQQDFDRLVVHYMLPHKPLIADALKWTPGKTSIERLMNGPEQIRELHSWEKSYAPVRNGEVSKAKLYNSYIKNLQLALEYVQILLENINADDVIITSDHGEAFGEQGIWAHPYGFPVGLVKSVPWATASASDQHTYEPTREPGKQDPNEHEREEVLKNLGYL